MERVKMCFIIIGNMVLRHIFTELKQLTVYEYKRLVTLQTSRQFHTCF